jgi:hypothetical protein
MSSQIDQAVSDIGSEIGPDIAYWTDPHLKKFTGLELLAIAGGAFLLGFIKGFSSKLGKRLGEKLGDSFADIILEKIDEAKGQDRATQDRLLEEAVKEAAAAMKASEIDPKDVPAIADDIERELLKVPERKAPPDVSERIARKVRDEALKVLTST